MTPLDQALAALRAGEPVRAQQIAADAVQRAREACGEHSAAYAQACFEQASVLASLGDYTRGAVAIRRAAEAKVPGGERDRLTYLMNLGEFLLRAGQPDEAEAVLREGLAGRAAFYGTEHPGYAYGIEPLAEVLLSKGETQEAATLLDTGIAVLRAANHPREGVLRVLRAAVAKTTWGPHAPSFPHGVETKQLEGVAQAALGRAERDDPVVALALLQDVVAVYAEARPGDALHHRLLATMTNVARKAGDHAARVEAFAQILSLTDDLGYRVDVLQAQAMALGDTGDQDAALAAYAEALRIAQGLTDAPAISQVQRNRALYLVDLGERQQAAEAFQIAVDVARDALDELMYGRALIARGIFRQHDGHLEAAARDLRRGIDRLPAHDHDALCGRSHLDAIERGTGCGCGDMPGALSEALMALVAPHVPAGLVAEIAVTLGENGPQVAIELTRKPTQAEAEALDRAINGGLAQLREGRGI